MFPTKQLCGNGGRESVEPLPLTTLNPRKPEEKHDLLAADDGDKHFFSTPKKKNTAYKTSPVDGYT